MKFPVLKSLNLQNLPFYIPDDLSENLNIIIIPFKRSNSSYLFSWKSFLMTLVSELSFISLYEFPIFSKRSKLNKRMINRNLKQKDENIIPFYLNKKEFKENLSIIDEKDVYIYLLTREGEILWYSQGEYNLDKAQKLKEKIIENM